MLTRPLISASWSEIGRPSGVAWTIPDASCRRNPPTRTMKYSSRLLLKIERNFTRSRSGTRPSVASCMTRALNASQLSSRFRYSDSDGACSGMDTPGCYWILLDGIQTRQKRRPHRLRERGIVQRRLHPLPVVQRPPKKIRQLLSLRGVGLPGVGDDPGERRDRVDA